MMHRNNTYNPDLPNCVAFNEELHANQVDKAYVALASDWGPMQELYSEDASLKFCWGGDTPGCEEGGVDNMLLPFHHALKTFKVMNCIITSATPQVLSIHWSNYMETPLGCGELTTGVAIMEFNEEGKVFHHVLLSDDPIHCIPKYQEAMMASTH